MEPARQVLERLRQWRIYALQPWRARALAVGACLSLLAAMAGSLPFLWRSQEALDLSLLFWVRGARPAPPEVMLIPIDGRAARSLFLPVAHEAFERCADVRREALPGYRNPDPPDVLTRWPRCLHAQALETLAVARPAAVVMDISFRPRSDPGQVFAEQDRRLARAMQALGSVVLIRRIRQDETPAASAQPIAGDIEAAALAIAPFLIVGDQLQRADKFCTFMESAPWSGACLPAVVHQLTALDLYPQLHKLFAVTGGRNTDLLPEPSAGLLAQRRLHAPVRLIRHLATAESGMPARLQAALALQRPALGAAEGVRLARLTDVYAGPATRYFNFYGPPGSFRTLRYESLVSDAGALRLEPGSLHDKVLFIGFAEQETPEPIEHFTTPFTNENSIKLSGVELAATAYANLRDGSAIAPAPAWLRALIALSIGLCCAALCVAFTPLRAIALCLLLAAAYFGCAVIAFDRYAAWLPLLIPLGVAVPAAVGSGLSARFFELKRDREHRGRIISVTLPPHVVDRILNQKAELADLEELVYGACISTDVQDYTRWAARRSPKVVRSVMDEYFAELKRVAAKCGADCADTGGDSMMAVWADRERSRSLRERVCAAALELAETAERFHRLHRQRRLVTRIGAHYGRIDIAMSGGSIQKEYRAVGDVPNTASRIQQLNEELGTRVLVSGALIRGLKGLRVRDLGLIRLRRKPDPTHVYELIGIQDQADRSTALDVVRKGTSAKSA